jgi:CheY-like chemotaxis protein
VVRILEECMSLRFLVVEDDPASCEFARSSLLAFGAVDTARTLSEAGDRCAEHPYDLLLVDVSLPDGQGDAWLARQRALGNHSPAVALTAELDPTRRRQLRASGFAEALGKPLAQSRLQDALAPWIGRREPDWDDAQALAALGGSEQTLRRMRTLFLDELPRQRERIVEARDRRDAPALRAVLHQLRAGCGFVGATALSRAVDNLHAHPDDAHAARALFRELDAVLASPPG